MPSARAGRKPSVRAGAAGVVAIAESACSEAGIEGFFLYKNWVNFYTRY